MITNFKLFEGKKTDIRITDIPENILDRILSDFNIIIWKGKKRNGQKNYKLIKPLIIDGYYNNSDITANGSENTFLLKISLSNNDYIEAKFENSSINGTNTTNNVYIEINQKTIFDLGDDNNDEEKFLSRVRDIYLRYLEKKKWKIK